jgi:hypothetical protein
MESTPGISELKYELSELKALASTKCSQKIRVFSAPDVYFMSIGKMTTYIRPTVKPRYQPLREFTTVARGGALVSEWTQVNHQSPVISGSYGRVGEIGDKMNLGLVQPKPKPFVPPHDYIFYAEKMIPKEQQEAYIKKCEEWMVAHPPKVTKKLQEPPVYDYASLADFWKLKTSLPSIPERVSAMEKAGMPREMIENHRMWDAMMDETSEKRQQSIDDIFGKYANSKTAAKPKTAKSKMLKPVKKKMLE